MKRVLAVILIIALAVFQLGAQFDFGGDIVFDPTSYAEIVLVYLELIKNYDQLRLEYELLSRMAELVPVNMPVRYRTPGTSWYGLEVPYDRFANLNGWLQAVNHGGAALGGYSGASVELRSYGSKFAQLPLDEQLKAESQYASTELADGVNVHSMETVGMLRANAAEAERAIENLTNDSLSLDPAMNTQIAVLNKINAASVASLRIGRDTNRALLSVLEQQVVDSKRLRDAHASEINVQIMRLERGDEAKAEHTSTITDSLRSFRWR